MRQYASFPRLDGQGHLALNDFTNLFRDGFASPFPGIQAAVQMVDLLKIEFF